MGQPYYTVEFQPSIGQWHVYISEMGSVSVFHEERQVAIDRAWQAYRVIMGD